MTEKTRTICCLWSDQMELDRSCNEKTGLKLHAVLGVQIVQQK
jgi:hypothetical protein